MYKSYKVELAPSEFQKHIFERDFEVCRMVHNLYLSKALEQIEKYGRYGDYERFLDWFYKTYLEENGKGFVKDFSRIAVLRVCRNLDGNLSKYLDGKAGKPKMKRLGTGRISLYVTNLTKRGEFIQVKEREVLLPGYGWNRLKEWGYIPVSTGNNRIINAVVSKDIDRYYVSVTLEIIEDTFSVGSGEYRGKLKGEPIGVDLGLINYATLSDGRVFPNINKTRRVEILEKRAERQQRALRRKIQRNSANYERNRVALLKTYRRLRNIRGNFLNELVAEIVKTNPKYVAIEDLGVSELMGKRNFARSVQHVMFYEFRTRLLKKCSSRGIEVRIVNRYYPSSKMCHNCGRIKRNLKLSERVYSCECGFSADRDYNASLNIRDANNYTIGKLI